MTLTICALAFVVVFVIGFIARMACVKVNDIAIVVPFMVLAMVPIGITLINLDILLAPIPSVYVHRSIQLWESEGGLQSIDQSRIICKSGVVFITKSLDKINPEQE